MKSAEEACDNADVIVTATLSSQPVVKGAWVKTGAMLCCVGACKPTWRELDDDIMNNSTVFVDTIDGALKESGDIIITKAKVTADLPNVLIQNPGEIKFDPGKKYVLFKTLGMAVLDISTAYMLLPKLQNRN